MLEAGVVPVLDEDLEVEGDVELDFEDGEGDAGGDAVEGGGEDLDPGLPGLEDGQD